MRSKREVVRYDDTAGYRAAQRFNFKPRVSTELSKTLRKNCRTVRRGSHVKAFGFRKVLQVNLPPCYGEIKTLEKLITVVKKHVLRI